jgi:hypothetical protein
VPPVDEALALEDATTFAGPALAFSEVTVRLPWTSWYQIYTVVIKDVDLNTTTNKAFFFLIFWGAYMLLHVSK